MAKIQRFADAYYGGEHLKQALLNALPGAYRQTLLRLKEATDQLKDVHLRHAIPLIQGFASPGVGNWGQ